MIQYDTVWYSMIQYDTVVQLSRRSVSVLQCTTVYSTIAYLPQATVAECWARPDRPQEQKWPDWRCIKLFHAILLLDLLASRDSQLAGISLQLVYLAMDQYLYIPFLVGWTWMNIHKSQLFWCSLGTRVLTHPQPWLFLFRALFWVRWFHCAAQGQSSTTKLHRELWGSLRPVSQPLLTSSIWNYVELYGDVLNHPC